MVLEVNSTNVFLTPVETVAEDETDRQTDRQYHFLHINFNRKMNCWNQTSIKSNCHIADIAVVLP